MRKIILLVLVWIFCANAFALVAWNRFNLKPDTAYTWIDARHLHTPSWSFLALPARWDSEWYLDIASSGYVYKGPKALSNIVFFPVYPVLIWLVQFLTLGNYVAAGWFISLAALIGACVMLDKYVKEFHPKLDSQVVILALLLFPTAIFFNAVYTESLFLLLSIATAYFVRKGRYREAGILGFVAALTRVTGVLLLVFALVEFFSHKQWKKNLREGAWLLLIPAGLASFFAYHAYAYGDPLLFFKIEANWGRAFTLNTTHLLTSTASAMANLGLDVGFFIFGLLISYYVIKKVRLSYGVYMLATIAVAISTGTLMSIGRYLLVLFPIPIAIAHLKPEHQRIVMMISTMLFALYATLFAHSYWSG
ncbi:MAG: mannosyltransferase family protein [Candidatus Uhrbacteria bacterium]